MNVSLYLLIVSCSIVPKFVNGETGAGQNFEIPTASTFKGEPLNATNSIIIDVKEELAKVETGMKDFINQDKNSPQQFLDARYAANFYEKKMENAGFAKKALLTIPWLAAVPLAKFQAGVLEYGYRTGYQGPNKDVNKAFQENLKSAYTNMALGATGFVVESVFIPYAVGSQIIASLTTAGIATVDSAGILIIDTVALKAFLGSSYAAMGVFATNLPRYIIFGGVKFIAKNLWSGGVIAIVINLMNAYLGQYQAFLNQEAEKAANASLLEAFKNQRQMFPDLGGVSEESLEEIDFNSAQNSYYEILTAYKATMAALPREGRSIIDDIKEQMVNWMTALNGIDTSITVAKMRIDDLLAKKSNNTFTEQDAEELKQLEARLKQNLIQRYNVTADIYSYLRRRPEFSTEVQRNIFRLGLATYGKEYKNFLDYQIEQLSQTSKEEANKSWLDYINQSYYRLSSH